MGQTQISLEFLTLRPQPLMPARFLFCSLSDTFNGNWVFKPRGRDSKNKYIIRHVSWLWAPWTGLSGWLVLIVSAASPSREADCVWSMNLELEVKNCASTRAIITIIKSGLAFFSVCYCTSHWVWQGFPLIIKTSEDVELGTGWL